MEDPRIATVLEADHDQGLLQEALEDLPAVFIAKFLDTPNELLVLQRVLIELLEHPLVEVVYSGAAVGLNLVGWTCHALYEHFEDGLDEIDFEF